MYAVFEVGVNAKRPKVLKVLHIFSARARVQ